MRIMQLLKISVLCLVLFAALAVTGQENAPTPTPTLVPTSTFTPAAPGGLTAEAELTAELSEEATEEIIELVVEVAPGQEVPPPVDIVLPENWIQINDAILLQDLDGLTVLPFTAYVGPVTGGQGYIILLWGFSSVAAGNPLGGSTIQLNPGLDGLRLLRLAVTDIGCVIGHDMDLEKEYAIGERIGYGTNFQAVDCPESPDTRGWFAGLVYENINMVFYAYAEPITAMDGRADEELQAILDTVVFDLENTFLIVSPTPTLNSIITPSGVTQTPPPTDTDTNAPITVTATLSGG